MEYQHTGRPTLIKRARFRCPIKSAKAARAIAFGQVALDKGCGHWQGLVDMKCSAIALFRRVEQYSCARVCALPNAASGHLSAADIHQVFGRKKHTARRQGEAR